MTGPKLRYDWDIVKALSNERKHGVAFESASTVFLDPFAATRYDDDHGGSEDRWVTIGLSSDQQLLVVVHTVVEIDPNEYLVRIISARRPTSQERDQYLN